MNNRWKVFAFLLLSFFLLHYVLKQKESANAHHTTKTKVIPNYHHVDMQVPNIEVYLPNYKNLDMLKVNLKLLQYRQSGVSANVTYTVLTQEENEEDRKAVSSYLSGMKGVRVIEFPQPGRVGGGALFGIFKAINALNYESDITVTVDTDAFILANNWDTRLTEIFSDPEIAVAGINPREGPFLGNAEWNWMAFRTSFYRIPIIQFSELSLHDWGHWFTKTATSNGFRQHLWNLSFNPISTRSPKVAGDSINPLWVIHLFYASRKNNEVLKEEDKWVVTADETKGILEWAAVNRLSYDANEFAKFLEDNTKSP